MQIVSEEQAYEDYDNSWDEGYGPIQIGSATFYPSQIIKKLDPVLYRIGFSEHLDYLAESEIYVTGWTTDEQPDE